MDDNMDANIYSRVDAYIDQLFGLEDATLAAVLKATADAGMPEIQISPSQGKFLYLLAKIAGARKILEIGTLAGYSTIWLGRALDKDGWLVSLELVEKHVELARRNLSAAGLNGIAEVRLGPALEGLEHLLAQDEGPFDLVFIDADKSGYPAYLEWAMKLTKSGSLIVADNIVRKGGVLDPETADENSRGARAFNAAIAADERLEAVVLQVVGAKGHDGLAIARVK
jgi:caffeoyl-CoA O-methyltransferase